MVKHVVKLSWFVICPENLVVVLGHDLVQFFEREMVNQQTRQISILCFRVVLFEVVLEILLDFPHGPSKNVKCRGFFFSFSRAHIEPNYGRLFPAVVDMDPSMCSNKGGSNRKKRKRMYSSGQPKLSAYARTRFRVWVVVLSQGNKIACPAEILW